MNDVEAEITVDGEPRTTRVVVIAVAVVLVALIAAIFVGCDRASERNRDVRKACIAAGGSWIVADTDTGGGHCVRQVVAP